MDDDTPCLLDVIGDQNALDSFLDPEELANATLASGNLGTQRFPELTLNTNDGGGSIGGNIDSDDFLADLFSPANLLSPFPNNGIQDSIQSAAALAGITSSDGFDDQISPPLSQEQPQTSNANTNQSNAVPQGGVPTNQPLQVLNNVPDSVFNFKTTTHQTQQRTATATFTATTATPSMSAPIQTLQPISNVSPQVPQQQQARPTITLPAGSNTGGGIQLALTPQQLALLQQGGGRFIPGPPQNSSSAIQVLPNTMTQMQQPQIVQAIQPNGTQVQLALLPSGMQLGPQYIIRQPIKPGIGASPSKMPANIQPKLNPSQVNKTPVNIRPYQVAQPMSAVQAGSGNIVLQQPRTGQTLQLTNLGPSPQLTNLGPSQQQPAQTQAQTVLFQNPASSTGIPVVTMGVSHGSIIVMTQTQPNTTVSQQQQLTTTVNSSGSKVSASSSSVSAQSPQPTKAKPKKKKSKKSKSKTKNKEATSGASTTQTTTTTTTSAIPLQTTQPVSYTQTFTSQNGQQTIMVQAPMKQGSAVPIVQQINTAAPGTQQSVNMIQLGHQQQGLQQVKQQIQGQYVGQQQQQQLAMSAAAAQQQIATNIPQQNATPMSASEQQQQYLIQQAIKLQKQQNQQQQQNLQAGPLSTTMPQTSQNQFQLPGQIQLQQSSQVQLQQPGQIQLQQPGQNQIQPAGGTQLPLSGQIQLQQLGQSQMQQASQIQLQQSGQIQLQQPGQVQNQLQQSSQIQLQQSSQNQLQQSQSNQIQLQQSGQNQLQQSVQNKLQQLGPTQLQQAEQNLVQQTVQNQLQQSGQNQIQQAGQSQLQQQIVQNPLQQPDQKPFLQSAQNQLQQSSQIQLPQSGQNLLQQSSQNQLQQSGQKQLQQPGQQVDPRQTPSPRPPIVQQIALGQQNQTAQSNPNQLQQPVQNQMAMGQSIQQQGAQIILGHSGLNQLNQMPGSQPAQNQVQLVSSSQSLQKIQPQMAQLQQPQPISISNVQRQPAPVVQKPVAAVAPQPAAPGVHVIRTAGQQNAPKSFKNVQELQQWLQQNPQALRQFQELKRQHMIKQQQLLQQQQQRQQQQQQQQQSDLQSKQEKTQQVIQSSVAQPQIQPNQLQPQVQVGQQQMQQQSQDQQQQLQKQPPNLQGQQQAVAQPQPTFQQQMTQQTAQPLEQSLQQQVQPVVSVQQNQQQPQQQVQQNQQQPHSQEQQQHSEQQKHQRRQSAFEKQFQQFIEKNKPPEEQQTDGQKSTVNPPSNLINSTPQMVPGPGGGYVIQQTPPPGQASPVGQASPAGQRAIHHLPKQVGGMLAQSTAPAASSAGTSSSSIQMSQAMAMQSQQPAAALTVQAVSDNSNMIKMEVQSSANQQQQQQQLSSSGHGIQQQQPQGMPTGGRQISIQTQQQLQVIQVNIRKLSAIASPNQQQKSLLQQLILLQNKVIQQARQHLMQNNPTTVLQQQPAASMGNTANVSAAAASQPTLGSSISSMSSTPSSSTLSQSINVQFMQQQPAPAQSTASDSSSLQENPHKKKGALGLKIVTGAKQLSPQQRLLMTQLTEQLKKLTPEQQKQLIQQQQLLKITPGKQGGKLIIQPASSSAAANPQNIASASKIIISTNQGGSSSSSSKKSDQDKKKSKSSYQGPSKVQIARSNRFARSLIKDQVRVQKTDFKEPFKNTMEAVTRLLPFHLCKDDTPTDRELEKAEVAYEDTCANLLLKKQEMVNKYQMLLYQESMRIDPSPEMVMIDRMYVLEEKMSLDADRKYHAEHPEIYDDIYANQPTKTVDSSSATDLDTTATTTTEDDAVAADAETSLVLPSSPTNSSKKLDRSDLYSPGSCATQGGSEANLSLSPADAKSVASPSSSSGHHDSTEKRANSESSSMDKSFDYESETDEQMDSSYENATVTKVSANDLKVTFRKQKKLPKKKGGSSDSDTVASYSVQNHKHKHNHGHRSPKKSHSNSAKVDAKVDAKVEVKVEANSGSSVKEQICTGNGSTSEKEAKPETKTHQRSDACVPFRKRKFKHIVDDAPVVLKDKDIDNRANDLLDSRTTPSSSSSSSSGSALTPVPFPQEKTSQVDNEDHCRSGKISRVNYEDSRSVFQFDNVSEEERTSDSVFKVDKPIIIGKSDFEFENVSDDEEDERHGDLLQEQMASAINSILDLQRGPPLPRRTSMAAEADAMLKRQVAAETAGLSFSSSALPPPPQPYQSGASAAGLGVGSAYSSTAMQFGNDGNTMGGLGYSSAFSMEDSNITRTVSSQEAFGTQPSFSGNSGGGVETDETSVVDDLQKELNLLQYGAPAVDDEQTATSGVDNLLGEGGNSGSHQRGADPDLQEAVNSILF